MAQFSLQALADINYWAVATAAIVTFFLGGLWYSPALFESVWMNANGYTEAQVKALPSSVGVAGFAATLVSYALLVFCFALFVVLLDIDRLSGGIVLGVILWAGFVAATSLATNLFSFRPFSAWLIDAGFQFLFMIITGAILSLWR